MGVNLRYYDPQLKGSTASYTGNISEWSWNQGSNPIFTYSFAYDNYGRFKDSRSFSNGIQKIIIPNTIYVMTGMEI